MSKDKTRRVSRSGSDRIIVRAKRRDEPDLRRLARALIELARKQTETGSAESNNTNGDTSIDGEGP